MCDWKQTKLVANQSNIFNIEEKEQFNQKVKYNQKTLNDKIEIGAYNVNWWNVNQYKQEIVEPQEELRPKIKEDQDPDDDLKKKNHLYSNIQISSNFQDYYKQQKDEKVERIIPSDIGWTKFDSRLHSKDYAGMKKQEKKLDQNYMKNQEEQPNQAQKAMYREMKSIFDQHQYYDNYKPQRKEKQVAQSEEILPGSKYSQRQMLKGMKSQLDSHNYYDKMLEKPQEVKQESPLKEIQQNLPTQFYINLIVRGVGSKFNWNKLKESLKTKNCTVGSVRELKQTSGKILYQITINSPNEKALNEAELLLFSQGMRVVQKEKLEEKDFKKICQPVVQRPKTKNVITLFSNL